RFLRRRGHRHCCRLSALRQLHASAIQSLARQRAVNMIPGRHAAFNYARGSGVLMLRWTIPECPGSPSGANGTPMSPVSLLLNVIWIVTGDAWMAVAWVF